MDLASIIFSFVTLNDVSRYRMTPWKMGSNLWQEVESAQLLRPEDFMQERLWEEEVKRRKMELLQHKRQFEKKRKINELRLAEITRRWRNLEGKRIRKSEEYLERMMTSLSLNNERTLLTPNAVSNNIM